MKTPKRIAIIPARGGSKRVPQKNVAFFKGTPLISYTIEQAINSKIFDEILVTTDDQTIIKYAEKYPVIVHERPAKLSEDKSTLLQVIRYYISLYGWSKNSILCLLQVTAPLRIIDDILNVNKMFDQSDKANAVVSVAENEHPVHLAWVKEGENLAPLFPKSYQATTRKQDHRPTYYWNDAVIADTVLNFMDPDRNLFGENPIPYIMPGERSINIDYEFQLKICQALAR